MKLSKKTKLMRARLFGYSRVMKALKSVPASERELVLKCALMMTMDNAITKQKE